VANNPGTPLPLPPFEQLKISFDQRRSGGGLLYGHYLGLEPAAVAMRYAQLPQLAVGSKSTRMCSKYSAPIRQSSHPFGVAKSLTRNGARPKGRRRNTGGFCPGKLTLGEILGQYFYQGFKPRDGIFPAVFFKGKFNFISSSTKI
jgi:hypothetical protein